MKRVSFYAAVGLSLFPLLSNPAAAQYQPFKLDCEGAEKDFSALCVKSYSGQIGFVQIGPQRQRVPSDIVSDLKTFGLVEVPYDPIKGIPEKNIPSIICQLNSSNMEINEKLTKDKIVMIDLVGCDKNVSDYARINSITMMNINQKLVIGAITGMFVGNAGNTVTEGSFREALENKFGKKNCDEKEKQNFCREDKQMITVSSYVGDDKREIEKKLGPQWALFSIEILSPEAFHTARKLAANRQNDMKSLPPPKF